MQLNRLRLVSLILSVFGFVSFVAAGYCYWALSDLFETLKYYGLESQYYTHEEVVATASNLKFGIAKFVAIGMVSWVAAFVLVVRRKQDTL
jgi:hypothetical protein